MIAFGCSNVIISYLFFAFVVIQYCLQRFSPLYLQKKQQQNFK